MKGMEKIIENTYIDFWIKRFQRSPHQFNEPHFADAELIEIPGDKNHFLAVTIDTLAEEITTGLYQQPYTMGWVAIMACLSDLGAVGAEPMGVVISVSVELRRENKFLGEVAQGIEDACRMLRVFVLGGDTSMTDSMSLTCCAFGLVSREKVITRRGCKPGEEVYMTGRAGVGNALGLAHLANLPAAFFPEKLYRPVARIKEGQIVRRYASCCMDTSDGLLATLDQLMRLNDIGFEINCDWERILAPIVLELCQKTNTPPWTMITGPHGEFELVFTVSAEAAGDIHSHHRALDITKLGKVQEKKVLALILPSGVTVNVDMSPIRNLLFTINGDLERYVKEFMSLGKKCGFE